MKSPLLLLYVNGDRLGSLERSSGKKPMFRYSPEWMKKHPALPISIRFPVREEAYSGNEVDIYLKNLLPDTERVLERIAAIHQVSSTDPYDLLSAIGRDCVGALQFISEPESSGIEKKSKKIEKKPITDREIAETIRNLKTQPLGIFNDDEFFRISLAGAQEKTALLKMDGQWFRPLEATPTTHILKPSVEVSFEGKPLAIDVENEWLSLKICGLFGLKIANADIEEFENVRVLSIERFDRLWSKDGKRIDRVIQEDFCQATATPPHLKYENKGGPGMVRILEILNQSDRPKEDRYHFFKTQVVFWLIGAIDGHAKNFSIQWSNSGFSLTPLYDVLSADPIVAQKGLSEKKIALAMAVEGKSRHYRIHEIVRRHWDETAKKSRIPQSDVDRIFSEVFTAVGSLRSEVGKILPKRFPAAVVEPILDGIESRLKRLE